MKIQIQNEFKENDLKDSKFLLFNGKFKRVYRKTWFLDFRLIPKILVYKMDNLKDKPRYSYGLNILWLFCRININFLK